MMPDKEDDPTCGNPYAPLLSLSSHLQCLMACLPPNYTACRRAKDNACGRERNITCVRCFRMFPHSPHSCPQVSPPFHPLSLHFVLLSDLRTVYTTDDGTNCGFFMFKADKEADLSCGTLYAAKLTQQGTSTSATDTSISFKVDWVKLGYGKSTVEGGGWWGHQHTMFGVYLSAPLFRIVMDQCG